MWQYSAVILKYTNNKAILAKYYFNVKYRTLHTTFILDKSWMKVPYFQSIFIILKHFKYIYVFQNCQQQKKKVQTRDFQKQQ